MRLIGWEVEGYKSIQEASISFDKQLLLTGKNDSGKSNFLQSFIDYQRLFDHTPGEGVVGDESYNNWWEKASCSYSEDDEIAFAATFTIGSEDRRELIEDLDGEVNAPPEWAENRVSNDDFSQIRHEIVIGPDSLKKELLISTVDGVNIPLAVRNVPDGHSVEFMYVRAGQSDEGETYASVADLAEVHLSEGFEDIIETGAPTGGNWYNDKQETWQIGGILNETFEESIREAINKWSKVDAFRNPDSPSESEYGTSESDEEPETESLHPGMENLQAVLQRIEQDRNGEGTEEINNEFTNAIEGVSDLEINYNPEKGIQEPELKRGGTKFRYGQLSTGSIQAISIITKLYTSKENNQLLIIEEPEAHLHSSAIRKVWDYIDSLVEEHELQLIVSSHSPTVVDISDSEKISLFKRDDVSTISIVDKDILSRNLFGTSRSLGELTQAEAIIFVEGEFMRWLVESVCTSYDLDPTEHGIEIIALEAVNRELLLDKYHPLMTLCSGTGIQTRLFLNEPQRGEDDRFLADWSDEYDDGTDSVTYFRGLPYTTSEWLARNIEEFLEEIGDVCGRDVAIPTSAFLEQLEISPDGVESGSQEQPHVTLGDIKGTEIFASERKLRTGEITLAMRNLDYDRDHWDDVLNHLEGLLE